MTRLRARKAIYKMGKKKVRIVFCSLFQDAGEATRALELARGLRRQCPPGLSPEIIFLSHGGRFDEAFAEAGFSVTPAKPALPGVGFRQDLKTSALEFVGDAGLAAELLRGEYEAMLEIRPDFVIHGFWPVAGMAAKLTGTPEICYLPVPFEPKAFSTWLLQDLPDFVGPLTLLPKTVRMKIMAAIPKSLKLKMPLLRQKNLVRAFELAGGKENRPENLFDMLKSDFTIINDFSVFYEGKPLPQNFAVTGPLFPKGTRDAEIDPEIQRRLKPDSGKLKIFCTLGSSGGKDFLLEAIRALKRMENCTSVVLCPPSVCPFQEAKNVAGGSPDLYLTDAFVPALKVNKMADVVLSHGGQGTLQTAVASGTPVVGFAVQPEQQINLEHIVSFGAAVRLPSRRWKADAICGALKTVGTDPHYRSKMQILQKLLTEIDGETEAAKAIWNFCSSQR